MGWIALFVALWALFAGLGIRIYNGTPLLPVVASALPALFAWLAIGMGLQYYQAEAERSAAKAAGFQDLATYRTAKAQGYEFAEGWEREIERREDAKTAQARREAERKAAQAKRREAERAAKAAQCAKDFDCWSRKALGTASEHCQQAVERKARYDYEWIDGWGLKFPLTLPGKQSDSAIYAGDRIKLQNGFGAWQRHTYLCEFDVKRERVVEVHIRAGRIN